VRIRRRTGGRVAGRPRAERTTTAVLSVRDLAVSYPGGVQALRGVSLEVAPGEIVGLVGESGAGKTVLGLAALGLLPPSAELDGHVFLGDTDMATATDEQRRIARKRFAGAVFQDPMTSLNPTMTVGRQVAEATGSMAAAIEALERARVPDAPRRARQYPHQLSGGLRQRVMIAMAVAGAPALIVADEPTTALDVTVQAEILQLLSDLRDQTGSSMLFVTHDFAVAASLADRVAVLYGGRLAEIGPTRELLQQPDHPYTTGLLAARPSPDSPRGRPLPVLPGEPPDPRAHVDACPFAPRCPLVTPACEERLPQVTAAPSHAGLVACLRAGESQPSLLQVHDRFPDRAPPGGRPPALRLNELTKAFGSRRFRHVAVDSLTLEVPAGGAVALVGESGCGKTTTLRMAAGLERPDSGTVEVGEGGRPQLVFQDAGASLTPWLTVGELLEERLRSEGFTAPQRAERARDVLSLVGLPISVLGLRARQLSGGQRQRIAIARAIAVPPALLACDEPISALDVSLAAAVLNLLCRLRAQLGMAILFVTHDMSVARLMGDDVAVMHAGHIVEEGPPETVLERPQHPQTRALLAAIPRLRSA
jgi:peptide/nickel transport system ATP-binding protein